MQKETFLSLTSLLQHNGVIDIMYGSFFKTISRYIKKKKQNEIFKYAHSYQCQGDSIYRYVTLWGGTSHHR